MILNTIIEEEKNPYDAFALALFERFEKDYAELCAAAVKQGFPKPKNQNTTAMQHAFEAGEKKGREEERERIWREANKLPIQEGRADLISLLDFQNVLYHSELDQSIS